MKKVNENLRIKAVAKMKNVSMKELAAASGINYYMISYYNTGKIIPPLEKLQMIADALKCDILELHEPSTPGFEHFYIGGKWSGIRNAELIKDDPTTLEEVVLNFVNR